MELKTQHELGQFPPSWKSETIEYDLKLQHINTWKKYFDNNNKKNIFTMS